MVNIHEKTLNFTDYQGNEIQIQNEISSQIRQTIKKISNKHRNRKPLWIAVENVKWYSHYGKQYGGVSKIKNRITIRHTNSTYYPKDTKEC